MFGLVKSILFFFFCVTSFFSICFALVIFFADNTIYAALSLIGLFFCSFVLLLIIKAEFLAIIYLMLYIGAVAVIFLFAVMFVDLRLEDTWTDLNYTKNYGVALFIFFKLLVVLQFVPSNAGFFFKPIRAVLIIFTHRLALFLNLIIFLVIYFVYPIYCILTTCCTWYCWA